MRSPRVTVVIPSHRHGELLLWSARSALGQTVSDLELFIVLDGADNVTRSTALALAEGDSRVRVFDHPKGERTGEVARDLALREAAGEFVCYLSDDDLWFPDHVEHMIRLLDDADFASALAVFHTDRETTHTLPGDLSDPSFRTRLLGEPPFNFFGLSQGAHTRAAYLRLERGWHPGPTSIPSDLHMWRHFLETEWVRAVSSDRVTLFTFPSPPRASWSSEERVAEIEEWFHRVVDTDWVEEYRRGFGEVLRADLLAAARRNLELEAEVRSRTAGGGGTTADLVEASGRFSAAESELAAVHASISYRAARRVAGVPVLGRIGRWVGRLLAGR